MIGLDLIAVCGGMLAMFFRHASVYKDPNKINYAPIVLSTGIVGTLFHLGLHADLPIGGALLRESVLPMALGMALWAVMSVMSQSVRSQNATSAREGIAAAEEELGSLTQGVAEFGRKLERMVQLEDAEHRHLRHAFQEEIEALTTIQANQKVFITKIESLLAKQQLAMEKFEEFTLTELPGLDNIVHRHIDLLRISEQDHFNQLKHALKMGFDELRQMAPRLEALSQEIGRINTEPAKATFAAVQIELEKIIREFARHIQTIASKSESIGTTLLENDAILKGSREQSELIMQQMVLSSKQMRELTQHSKELGEALKPITRTLVSSEELHREFADAKGKLTELVIMLDAHERHDRRNLSDRLEESFGALMTQLESLSRHLEQLPKPSPNVDPKNVQELASRVRLRSGYAPDLQE